MKNIWWLFPALFLLGCASQRSLVTDSNWPDIKIENQDYGKLPEGF